MKAFPVIAAVVLGLTGSASIVSAQSWGGGGYGERDRSYGERDRSYRERDRYDDRDRGYRGQGRQTDDRKWRRGRDWNPRRVAPNRISSAAP